MGSTDFRQEGLRFRSVRLFDRGELNEEVMRIIAGNIRTESGTLKDVQAMIAVCRVGIAYFQEILGKYGRDTVLDATRVYMEQSERRTRAELARIPSGVYRGVYRAVGHFDNDGITLDRPVRIEMAIAIGDGGMHVDFTGSAPQVTGPFNCGDADAGITIEPNPSRVIVRLDADIIADSTRALVMRALGTPPVQYVPRADVDMTRLTRTSLVTHCPYKGEAAVPTGSYAERPIRGAYVKFSDAPSRTAGAPPVPPRHATHRSCCLRSRIQRIQSPVLFSRRQRTHSSGRASRRASTFGTSQRYM